MRDFGIGSGGDDTAAWARLLAAAPDYSAIVLPQGVRSSASLIDLTKRRGLKFVGTNAGAESNFGSGQPTISYVGAPGGSLVAAGGAQDLSFEGILFDANGLAARLYQGFYQDQPSYNVAFRRCAFDRNARTSVGRPDFIAIDWGGTGPTSNCEQLSVEQCSIRGSGHGSASIGVLIGHSNATLDKIEGCNIVYCGTGISSAAMTKVTRNLFDNNDVDIAMQGSEPCKIDLNRTENGGQFFRGNCPVAIRSNRLGSHIDGADGWIANGATASINTIFENNVFSDDDAMPPFSMACGGSLFSFSNHYPIAAVVAQRVASMGRFTGGYQTMGDKCYGSWVLPEMNGWGPWIIS